MHVQIYHMVNIDVPAGVGAPPLDTQHSLFRPILHSFFPFSGALRTGSRDSEAVLWQTLNQFYDK